MLNLQFIGLNLSFAANLLAALVSFGVFWLIFDAWTVHRHQRVEIWKWSGFLALALGFLLHAAGLESGGQGLSGLVSHFSDMLRIAGYALIALGQVFDPLQERPHYEADPELAPESPAPKPPQAPPADPSPDSVPDDLTAAAPEDSPAADHATSPVAKVTVKPRRPRHAHSGFAAFLGAGSTVLLPGLAALVGGLYLRRATTGLERHLLPVAYGFGAFGLFEALNDASRLSNTTNPALYQLVATYGPVWWLALAALLAACGILGYWVWQYLTKRLQTELFMILICQTLALFLVSTVGFTFMLFQNIRTQSLGDLTTASRVLGYAVTSQQSETTAQAEAAASSAAVINAVTAHDHNSLVTALSGYLPAHSLTSLVVTDGSAQVLLRGEDPTRWGDSRSSDNLVRRALVGESASGVVVADGAIAPTITLVAAYPIRDSAGLVIGSVTAGRAITGAFVDGIRASTGLESSVYGGNVRAATTLLASNQIDRAIGVKETSTAITDQVLKHSKTFSGTTTLQDRSYLASFTPLRDGNNVTVGMLLVARPEDSLFTAANHSIQLTFSFIILLVVLSIYPVYLIARYLSRQLK